MAEETKILYLCKTTDDKDTNHESYEFKESSKEYKQIVQAYEEDMCMVWKFGAAPFNPNQGGHEDYVVFVPFTYRFTPPFFEFYQHWYHMTKYYVMDEEDEQIGTVYVYCH